VFLKLEIHKKTPEGNRLATSRGNAFDNGKDLLQRDIDELKRVYPEVPKEKLDELVKKIKKCILMHFLNHVQLILKENQYG